MNNIYYPKLLMIKMKNFIKVVLLLFVLSNYSSAQRVLTLDDALSIALSKSYSIKSAGYSLESSQKTLEALQRGLLSSVNLQFDFET